MTSQPSGQIATMLGRNIRLSRDARGMTQRELADAIGVDSMAVSKWERGRHRPSEENLLAIARLFERDLAWFYADHPDDAVAA